MNRVRELRNENGMKQEVLAGMLSVRRQTVSRYETGQLDLDTDTIMRLCQIFGCTSDYLLGISDRRAPDVTGAEAELLAAYAAATPEIRGIVDTALAPYKPKKIEAAG